MENFIEKLKTVDKKVWIGVGIGVAVLIILIVALVIGSGNNKKPNGDTQGTQGTETEGGVTEVFGTEDVTEVLGTEMATETEMGTETEMTETESESESQSQGQGGTTDKKPETESGDTLGAGSKAQPYEVIPDTSNMTVTTVTIPAGKSVYYKIQRTAGKWFSIEDSNAYVVFNGTKYDAKNGKVGFQVKDEKALVTDYLLFEIGNTGSSSKSFTIKLSDLKGSQMNPEKISSVGTYTINVASGNKEGYYYKYSAQQTGTIRFYIKSATEDSNITVTNNSGAGTVQRSFSESLTDEQGNAYIEIEVNKGDELVIQVGANPTPRFKYPATTVTWEMKYM